jgi:MoxR-like ATPase
VWDECGMVYQGLLRMHEVGVASETDHETASRGGKRQPLAISHLFLVLECERPWAGGARHDLGSIDQVRIGRGSRREATRSVVGGKRVLSLRVPDPRMSHAHARLTRVDTRFVFEDLGSTNGSLLRGESVASPVALRDGDVLEVGRTFFRFRAALPTLPGTTADLDFAADLRKAAPGFATLLPALAEKHTNLAKVAGSRVPVLLLGETGAGKEVLARAIHEASRRPGPFVPINCAAIPPTLMEAQLFGHVRGAFSGATRDEPGVVRSAHQGTLLLDEVGDLTKSAQGALLRVLQEGEVTPVGSARPQRVDLRIICATNSDLPGDVRRGAFRSDLFGRLAGLRQTLSPLRERMEDLGLIVASLLGRMASEDERRTTFTRDAGRRLLEHAWPGNVRELEHVLSVALVLAEGDPIDVEHLTKGEFEPCAARGKSRSDRREDEAIRARLVDELQRATGNVAAVARTMGKARMQVQRWMKRFNLDPKMFRGDRAPRA